MLVAFALAHEYVNQNSVKDSTSFYSSLIEGALFDYLYRLVITDIKPPVFYRIRENEGHYQKLTSHVLNKLEPVVAPLGDFWIRMQSWHVSRYDNKDPVRRILSAAHLFASQWEFQLIRPHNPFDEEMESIARSFDDNLNAYCNLACLDQIRNSSTALGKFANLCGQLRFQIRWTQISRMPSTSVLGHTFLVAASAYLFSLQLQTSCTRANNNFFIGLFHDFPELLTRDIISPVKSSVPELSQLIKEYEESELTRRILDPLKSAGYVALVERISYFLGLQTGSEFQEACIINGQPVSITSFDELCKMDKDENDPRDGALIKNCDLLSAFLEVHNSIANGVSSPQLHEARARLKSRLMEDALPGMNLEALLADFD